MPEKKHEAKLKATTGYFESGLPYLRIGSDPRILVVFEGLGFENKPPSGLMLRMYVGSARGVPE